MLKATWKPESWAGSLQPTLQYLDFQVAFGNTWYSHWVGDLWPNVETNIFVCVNIFLWHNIKFWQKIYIFSSSSKWRHLPICNVHLWSAQINIEKVIEWTEKEKQRQRGWVSQFYINIRIQEMEKKLWTMTLPNNQLAKSNNNPTISTTHVSDPLMKCWLCNC